MGDLTRFPKVVVVIGPNSNQIFGVYRNYETAEWEIADYRQYLMENDINIEQYNFIIKSEDVLG